MPLNLINVLPTQLVFAYACVRMLDFKHPVWFITAQLVLIAICIPVRAFNADLGVFLGFVVTLLPVVIARDALPRRVFVTACCVIALIIAEIPASLVWSALTGVLLSDYQVILIHLPEFILVSLIHAMMIMVLCALVEVVLNRYASTESETSIKLFLWFALGQMVLMFAFCQVLVDVIATSWDVVWFGSCAVAACCVADAAMFVIFAWFSKKEKEERRAALMKEQFEAYLEDCENIAQALEGAAKMRHDLRNQMQVVYALIDRGDYEEAACYLEEMQKIVRSTKNAMSVPQ